MLPRFLPLFLTGLIALGCTAFSGCATHSARASYVEGTPKSSWQFDEIGSGLPPAKLVYVGDGQAIGPDLQVHSVRLFTLQNHVLLDAGATSFNYTVAVSTDDFHVMSIYTACNSLSVPKNGPAHCDDNEVLVLPSGELSLFFNVPLILDRVPPAGGNFEVPVWSAGKVKQAMFNAETTGQTVTIRRVGPRAVENFGLDDGRRSSGLVTNCDVFRNGIITIMPEAVECVDSKGFRWRVTTPIPVIHSHWGASKFSPPFAVESAPHDLAPSADHLNFSLSAAIAAGRINVPKFKEITDAPSWSLGNSSYDFDGSTTLGPLLCENYSWVMTVSLPTGESDSVVASHQVCNNGVGLPDSAKEVDEHAAPFAVSEAAINYGALAQWMLQTLCLSPKELSYSTIVRSATDGNQTWLSAGWSPNQGSGGVALYGLQAQSARGYLLNIHRAGGHGLLESLFETGQTNCTTTAS